MADKENGEEEKNLKKVLEGVLQAGESIYARGVGRSAKDDNGVSLPPGGLMLATNFRLLILGHQKTHRFYLEVALPYDEIKEVAYYGNSSLPAAPKKAVYITSNRGEMYRLLTVEEKNGVAFVDFVRSMMKANESIKGFEC